jgi:hypothetical protein
MWAILLVFVQAAAGCTVEAGGLSFDLASVSPLLPPRRLRSRRRAEGFRTARPPYEYNFAPCGTCGGPCRPPPCEGSFPEATAYQYEGAGPSGRCVAAIGSPSASVATVRGGLPPFALRHQTKSFTAPLDASQMFASPTASQAVAPEAGATSRCPHFSLTYFLGLCLTAPTPPWPPRPPWRAPRVITSFRIGPRRRGVGPPSGLARAGSLSSCEGGGVRWANKRTPLICEGSSSHSLCICPSASFTKSSAGGCPLA